MSWSYLWVSLGSSQSDSAVALPVYVPCFLCDPKQSEEPAGTVLITLALWLTLTTNCFWQHAELWEAVGRFYPTSLWITIYWKLIIKWKMVILYLSLYIYSPTHPFSHTVCTHGGKSALHRHQQATRTSVGLGTMSGFIYYLNKISEITILLTRANIVGVL